MPPGRIHRRCCPSSYIAVVLVRSKGPRGEGDDILACDTVMRVLDRVRLDIAFENHVFAGIVIDGIITAPHHLYWRVSMWFKTRSRGVGIRGRIRRRIAGRV